MNERLTRLQDYPFTRLGHLLAPVDRPSQQSAIALSIGEPRHRPAEFLLDILADRDQLAQDLRSYPATRGSDGLRAAICDWLSRRFDVSLDPGAQVLPVNGTREALFSVAQACLSGASGTLVGMPNPFYQIYEGAALLAGAQPLYMNCTSATGFCQDFAALDDDALGPDVWQRLQLLYLCSPGNPTGQVTATDALVPLVQKALEHDVILVADECYAEIYRDESNPPASLLNACIEAGNHDYRNCLVMHSLSKRSNLPGLRSGFVAGDAHLMQAYLQYRTYHGCAMSAHHQRVSIAAWQDDAHVADNRALYRRKFAVVQPILEPHFDLRAPEAGFYHWLPTPIDDEQFTKRLVETQNVTVLPGRYLGREAQGFNPGANYVRIAWVSEFEQCVEGAMRLAEFAKTL